MNNDATAVDRWNDDGGAFPKRDVLASRDQHVPKVPINLADNPKITLNTPGEWKSERVRPDSSYSLTTVLDYIPTLHGKVVAAREIFRSKYHRPDKTDD